MSATPCRTCTSTCQKDAYTTSTTVEVTPTPYSTTTSGISATDGIGRRNSTVEAVTARSTGRLPITTPATTPATTAMTRPSAQVRNVSIRACQKSGRVACSASATAIGLVGGT